MMAGGPAGPQPAHADRMVEPGRGLGAGNLEEDPPGPPGSRRPPDRERQATHPQNVQGRHRRTAGCAPTARRSIYRARLTPGWQRCRKSRRNHRATPGCCPAMRRQGPKPRAAVHPGPPHGVERHRIPNRESSHRDQRSPPGSRKAAKLKNHSKCSKTTPEPRAS